MFGAPDPKSSHKAEVKKALVWVKLHHVPIVAYSEGRSSYARALIEVSAEKELIKSIVVAMRLQSKESAVDSEVSIELIKKKIKCKQLLRRSIWLEFGWGNLILTYDPILNVSDSEVNEEIMMEDSNGVELLPKQKEESISISENNYFRTLGAGRSMRLVKQGYTRIILGRNNNDFDDLLCLLPNDDQAISLAQCAQGGRRRTVLLFLLDSVQTLLDIDPYNTSLRAKEAACVVAFNEAALLEERMLKQRAKITWLKEGDSNSTNFHKAVKSRVSRSLVGETMAFVDDNLFKTRLHDQIALNMIWEVTTQEVKQAMFSIGCAFKVDIQKAYDTVDSEFLRRILHGLGFHARMVSWIIECVSTTSYFICINGNLHGYFKGNRGLRQLDLINLCFVDDLFLFTYGDVHSAGIIKEALDEFKNSSGLTPSLPKSTSYICNNVKRGKAKCLGGGCPPKQERDLGIRSCRMACHHLDVPKKHLLEVMLNSSRSIFDEKRGTIFNSNKEIVMIAPRVRDVYVLDMTSSAQESCFFAKANENLN
ncbi:putative reverse transcriptase domain, reverse transcriptase zinc-binding domain protein [Tanacetum coccineum]|uniref:Reverse transcriptase domain, reverse transcriptase zinc-binding domain protein n=1 Tax=Tanacetum coccineum TaxID=301880 RepID=A0ABQ5GX60_9ASTR